MKRVSRPGRIAGATAAFTLAVTALSGCADGAIQSQSTTPTEDKTAQSEKSDEAAPKEDADYVLRGGVVQTMVSEDDVAQAVAIKGDTIIYVGDDAGVEKFIGDNTEVVELDGAMVTPGFMDGHIHGTDIGVERMYKVDMTGLASNEDYVDAVKQFVTAHTDMDEYYGGPFMLNVYQKSDGSNPGPQKEDLDSVSKDKPIVIYDVAHHSSWVNSKALEMAGITADTPNPNGGVIWKNDAGEPTGYLTDSAADLVYAAVPELEVTDEMYREALIDVQEEANSFGITGFTNFTSEDSVRVASEMDKAGELTLRMRVVPMTLPTTTFEEMDSMVKAFEGYSSDLVTAGTIKLFADGVTESATAVMLEPYLEAAGHGHDWYGEPIRDDETFDELVKKLDAAGYQIHIHAIGDGAVTQSLDAFEAAREANGERDARHTITHISAISKDDIPRLADLDVIAALQFLWMYGDPLYELEAAFVGEDRALAFYPTRDEYDAGVVIAGASDAPVTPYNVLDEIEVGVTRNSPYPGEDKEDFYRWPEQALTPYEMLQAYTTNVAYENFVDDIIGTIEVGKKADLVVLGENLLTVEPSKISDIPILYTFSNGREVYKGEQ